MKEALTGTPVAALPGGVWLSADGSVSQPEAMGSAPSAEGPPAVTGPPMTLNKAGEAASQPTSIKRPSPTLLAPLPPAPIPNNGQAPTSTLDRDGIAKLLGST